MVESCSGLTGDFASVGWYVVPGVDQLPNGATGTWYSATNQIVFAGQSALQGSGVRHEMLHALLRLPGHTREYFLGRCEGVVYCANQCEIDAGGRTVPSATAPEVLPHEMGTQITVAPTEPSTTAYGGAMAVTVSITNPYPYDVWIRLTPNGPTSSIADTFGVIFDVGDAAHPRSGQAVGSTTPRFGIGANETRRYVWDEVLGTGPLQASQIGVRVYFNVDTSARLSFAVQK